MKKFSELNEQEILALAITLEEEDERIYADFAAALRDDFPATEAVLKGMGAEETVHRQRLTELFRKKFGEHIPLLRRQDVKGFVQRRPLWLVRPLGLDAVRRFTAGMELETRQFYEKAAARTADPEIRRLLDDLAQAERRHELNAERLSDKYLNPDARAVEAAAQRRLAWPGSWTAASPPWPRCLRRPRPRTIPGRPFWWAWRPHWARASAWVLPRPFQTTAALPGAGTPGCADWSAGS
jgi:rubrerythrin